MVAPREDGACRIDGKDVARANVHTRAHGNNKIDGGREDQVGDFAAPAQSAGDDGKHRQGEQREQAQGRLDQDRDGKVPPDSMGVNVAEDKGGVVLRHDFHVSEAHQF